jgi:hypothetical protein
MNEERYSVVHHPQLPVTSLHHGWRKQEKQTQTLGEAISSISLLLTHSQPILKSTNMSTSLLTVSQVLQTIPAGTKSKANNINGGIMGLAEVKELQNKTTFKPFWKITLIDEDTGQTIAILVYTFPKITNNQRISITGDSMGRIEDNIYNKIVTPMFICKNPFIQVLDFAPHMSHPDLDPVPKKLSFAQKSLSEPIGGFHNEMKNNSLFMAHCIIYAKQTIEAVASVKSQLAQQLDDKEIIKCLAASFFIEGNRQGLNKDVPLLTIPNIAVKKVTPAMAANLENTDGSETGDEDAPF